MATVTRIFTPVSLKSWHRRLGHPSYTNLKHEQDESRQRYSLLQDIHQSQTKAPPLI